MLGNSGAAVTPAIGWRCSPESGSASDPPQMAARMTLGQSQEAVSCTVLVDLVTPMSSSKAVLSSRSHERALQPHCNLGA